MRYLFYSLLLLIVTALPAVAGPSNTSGPWGIDAGGFRNLSTALASPMTAGKTVVVSQPMAINNKTSNRTIMVWKGGKITVATGKTFTSTGYIQSGPYQIFDGAGSVVLNQDSYLAWFGTTVTNWGSAVAATPVGKTMYVTDALAFSAVATVDKNIGVVMSPGIYLTRTGSGVGIDFTGSLQRATIDVTVVRSPANWTAGNVGIQIKDCISSTVRWGASGHEKGLYVNSTSGTVYDTQFYPREVFNNQYGEYLHSNGGNVNGNAIWGGRWSEDGTTNTTVNRYGIYNLDAGTNKFYGPLIEIFSGGTGKAYTMFNAGESKQNQIIGGYLEQQDYVLGASGAARFNHVDAHAAGPVAVNAYDQIDESASDYPGTNTLDWVSNRNTSLSKLGTQEVFNVSNVKQRALVNSFSSGSPRYVIPDFTWLGSSGTFGLMQVTDIELNDQYLQLGINAALGRKIDTSKTKRFWASVEKLSGKHNILVRCFDAAGNTLSGGGHVKGLSVNIDNTLSFETTAGFGGAYALYAAEDVAYFQVADTVKSIWVGVFALDNPVQITGLSVKVEGNQSVPASWPGFDLVAADTYGDFNSLDLALDTAPEGGVLANNQRVWHLDGVTGEPAGWIITKRHTTQATVGEPAGETVIAVSSITGVTSGDVLGVMITKAADSTTRWHWTTVSGAPSGGNITMAAGVPTGYSIAAGAKLITYLPKAMANI